MPRPRRRRPLIAGRSRTPFEPLERRQLMCAAHAATFQWTIPNDPMSFASERLRISALDDIPAPASFAALTAPAATGDVSGLPILNSNPGASVDVYLDFDGDGGGGGQMVTPYDTNGDPNTFDAAEAAVVTQSWQFVSSYFAMFDVNVTTATPTKPFAWCAIGNNVTGGYSYVGVFPQTLGSGPASFTASSFAQNRASGIAHEVGHNFGLQHEADFDALGKLAAEYTSGYDAQHGAIMGVDYAERVHKWFYGHPSNNVNALQDDMAVIAGRIGQISGGDGYRVDDVGGTIAAAASTAFNGVDQTRAGILERLGDADVFSFTSAGGRYLVSAARDVESPADVKLDILDGSNHLIASEDLPGANDADVAVDLPAGTYYARVASHGNYDDLGQYVLTVSPMPAATSFDSSDVGGTLRRAGGASYDASSATWTLRGSGTDIGSFADQFRYAYQPLRGDGSITAHLTGLSGGGTFAKAGLMIRESLAAGAQMATADFRGDGNVESIRRNATDAAASATLGGVAGIGTWLRLTRAGDTITAERSVDGVAWTTVASYTLAMNAAVFIGLAVTSNRDTAVATGTFDHVAVTGDAGNQTFTDNGLPAPTNLAVAPAAGSGLSVSWNAVAGAGSYVLERSTDGETFAPIATLASTSFTDPALDGSYRYYYRVGALLGADASARGTPAIASGVNRPSVVTGVTTMSISTSSISIDWHDTTGEIGYRLERSKDNFATVTTVATLGANQTSYVNKFLTASANYAYRIVPLSALGDGPSVTVVEGTRLAAVSGVRVSNATTDSLVVNWTDLDKVETGYRIERSTDTLAWSTIANVGGDVTQYADGGLSPFTTYYYRVTATSASTESLSGTVGMGATQADPVSQPLPTGWSGIDVGNGVGTGASGSAGAGVFKLIGNAPDPDGTGDQFRFAFRHLDGDGELIARLDSLDVFGARVGVMFRESLTADSRYGFISLASYGTATQFESRGATGGTTSVVPGATASVPVWVRLVRSGDQISGYSSADGSTWSLVGSGNVPMGSSIFVGLAVVSETIDHLVTTRFSNVGGSAAGQTDTVAPDAPTFAITDDTGASPSDGITRDNTLLITGSGEPGATLVLAQNGTTLTSFVVGSDGNWQYAVPTLADGIYAFTATATDASGNVSTAGTHTMAVDTTSPAVTSSTFDRATGHRWLIQFNDDVGSSISANDFAIVNMATSASITPVLSYDASTHAATLTLGGNARLPEGRYELRLAVGAVTDLAGNDSTTAMTLAFGVLGADFDGNGTVDFNDLLTLAKHFGQTGQTFAGGNADYDAAGTVDFNDLLLLAKAYGATLPAAAAAAPVVPSTTRKRTANTFSDVTI